jgi:hypothetical protein
MKQWLSYAMMLAAATPMVARALPDLALDTVVVTGDAVRAMVANRGAASSFGCNVDLQLFDRRTHRITGSRRSSVAVLAPGASQQVVFRMEPEFAGQEMRLVVDPLGRVLETDERNNHSEVVEAPSPRPGPIHIPKGTGNERKPPVRITGTTLPPRPPAETEDPAQPRVDLAAEAVANNGIVMKGTVRNVSALEFSGHRRGILSRETWGSAHLIERADVAERAVPPLVPGEEFVIEVKSPPTHKDARKYVFRLRLEPGDDNADNDVVNKTSAVVRID